MTSNTKSLPSRNLKPQAVQSSPPSSTPSATSTPDQTPKKSKGKPTNKKSPSDGKTRSLYSFFNTATQKQQERSEPQKSLTASRPELLEDIIKDDSSDDSISTHQKPEPNTDQYSHTLLPQKRSFHDENQPAIIAGSNKFLKKTDSSKTRLTEVPVEVDLRPWNEQYGPADLNDVVVHKKKLSDVRVWLENSVNGRPYFRLLVLKGPAGSGKTTILTTLCKSLGLEIVEWRNPTSSDYLSDSSLSISNQFEEFLGRGSIFGGLYMISDEATHEPASQPTTTPQAINERQALLVEEFPNNLTRQSKILQSFRSSVLQFLESSAQRTTPLVMIISETVVSDSNSSVDNFTAHRLLGPDILHHPNTAVVEFNPVAPTFIQKALKMVLQKRRRDVGAQYEPSDETIKRLSEFGDIRNAVSTLEFICSQPRDFITQNSIATSSTKSRSTKSKPSTQDLKKSASASKDLSLIALRETSIGLFHAVGKVMYNKRTAIPDGSNSTEPSSPPSYPAHKAHLDKSMRLEIEPDKLFDETGTEVSTFLSALHENYLLSCYSPNGNDEATLEHVIGCVDALTDADILMSTNSIFNYTSGISGFRQSELAFQTGVRGMLLNLPYPVKRQAPPGRSKADAFRMFYPTSLKLWNKREEIKQTVDTLADRAIKNFLNTRAPQEQNLDANLYIHNGEGATKSTALQRIVIGSGHSARYEMLMERLPYMARMLETRMHKASYQFQNQIERVTTFTGVGVLEDEDEEEEDSETLRVPKSTSAGSAQSSNQKRTIYTLFNSKEPPKRKGVEDLELEEKLVLSDDDIEDDET